MSVFASIVSSFSEPKVFLPQIGAAQVHVLEDDEEGERIVSRNQKLEPFFSSKKKKDKAHTIGVFRDTRKGRTSWRAAATYDGKSVYLYCGPSEQEAIKARKAWEKEHKEWAKRRGVSRKVKVAAGVLSSLRPARRYLPTVVKGVYGYKTNEGKTYCARGYAQKEYVLYRGPDLREAIRLRKQWELEQINKGVTDMKKKSLKKLVDEADRMIMDLEYRYALLENEMVVGAHDADCREKALIQATTYILETYPKKEIIPMTEDIFFQYVYAAAGLRKLK